MTEATRIQGATKSYREHVADWDEARLREEGESLGIPGAETLDLTTLREEIVQHWRDDVRKAATLDPQPETISDRHGDTNPEE